MSEAFICDTVRTPIGRYGGALSSVRTDDLAAIPLRTLVARNSAIDPEAFDDVILGCANQAGEDNRNVARMSLLLSGLPVGVSGLTVNRLCASGLEAVALASRAIKSDEADLIMAGGVEGMSRAPYVVSKAGKAFERSQRFEDTTMGWRFVNSAFEEAFGTDSMPRTAENVAEQYSVSRKDQDLFACRSQQRAAAARDRGFFDDEIIPVPIKGRSGELIDIDEDEHLRPDTTIDVLNRLKPLFRPNGSVTAGNSSGINDGAAAMIIASQKAASDYGLKPLARIIGYSTAGVEPRVMGVGPLSAVEKLNNKLGLAITDYDIIEINEAFASQALAVIRGFGMPDDAEHINPNGGAIALGHPLGMSGARIVQTLIHALKEKGGRFGLATLCVGVGMGAAMAIETV